MKLWQKENSKKTNEIIEKFTVGKDRELDIFLAPFDVLGSIAHGVMLEKIGLLNSTELSDIIKECREIYFEKISKDNFKIDEGVEDVHSQIEILLTEKLGDTGKKIHSGRSRNDQVLVDMKMYIRQKIEDIVELSQSLFTALISKSELHKNVLLPGYTHLQIAMPSSFGLWFGAYAESLVDDLISLQSVYKIVNKNPLGSGAGYGSSFPLKRHLTKDLLGFDELNYNVAYAQMTRGKMEFLMAQAIAVFANTISKMAMDVCLYNSQNFGFLTLPEEMTTGSSIMPHKKNPDVAEILRGKANKLKGLSTEIAFVQSNLPSGYHREFQLIKELIIPAITEFEDCLKVATFMIENLQVKSNILADKKYDPIFSVENVNAAVVKGMPFRDAYKAIGQDIGNDSFVPLKDLNHTLEGSIGNLCNADINAMMKDVIASFNFGKVHAAFERLLHADISEL
jgi:argininosuccinate lyase